MFRIAMRFFAKKKAKAPVSNSKLNTEERMKIESLLTQTVVTKEIQTKTYPINEQVNYQGEAEVINWENRFIERAQLDRARQIAQQSGLDLVLMRKDPPVVRIMNYSRYLLKSASDMYTTSIKYQVKNQTKQIQFGTQIAQHDFNIKFEKIVSVLKQLMMVQITIKLKSQPNQEQRGQLLVSQIREKIKEIQSLPPCVINIQQSINSISLKITPMIKQDNSELEKLVNQSELYDIAGARQDQRRMQQKILKIKESVMKIEEDSEQDKVIEELMNTKAKQQRRSQSNILEELQDTFDSEFYKYQTSESHEDSDTQIRKKLGSKLTYKLSKRQIKF